MFILRWTTFSSYSALDSRGSIVLVDTYLAWIGASAYVASGGGFLAQLIWCFAMGDESTSYSSVALTIVVHIIFPVVVGSSILYFFGVDQRRSVVGGLLVMVGLFSRPAAFICSGTMAVAYWMAHGMRDLFPMLNDGELAAIYCFAFLLIAAKGPGIWGLGK